MYLVSSCLAGNKCRYDGRDNANEKVMQLVKEGKAVPVCPEQLGELSTPRIPCEIVRGEGGVKVITKEGEDRTEAFELGATRCLQIANALGIKQAILKSKSPSCGCGKIYDGTFSGHLIEGNGLTAQKLIESGIDVTNE